MVRIRSPPALSQQTFGSSQDDARCSHRPTRHESERHRRDLRSEVGRNQREARRREDEARRDLRAAAAAEFKMIESRDRDTDPRIHLFARNDGLPSQAR